MMHRTICRLLHRVHHSVGTKRRVSTCISHKYKKNANAPPSCIRSRRCENGATLNRYKSNDTSIPIVDAAKETVIPPTVRQLAMHALRSAVPMIGKYILLFLFASLLIYDDIMNLNQNSLSLLISLTLMILYVYPQDLDLWTTRS